MNTFTKTAIALLFSAAFILTTLPVFAAQEVPKKGDVIQLLIGGYEIEAQVISITAPSAPEQAKKTEQITNTTSEPPSIGDQQAKPKNSNLQEQYNSFAKSNPVKTGIQNLQDAVNNQVAKWYQLITGKKAADNISPNLASIKNTSIPMPIVYLGLGIIGIVILGWILRKRKKKRDYSEEE